MIQNKLIKYIEDNKNKPITVGINDCNIIALEVIDLFLETKYSALKGQYKSYKKGLRLAKEAYGYTFVSELINDIALPIEIERISTGDILISNKELYSCCFIAVGNGFFTANITTNQTEIIFMSDFELKELKAYRLNKR
uniref:DUF6950 family protein n=1 Tax=Shewanella sp. TaxID=50422 RepID=UPI0040477A67